MRTVRVSLPITDTWVLSIAQVQMEINRHFALQGIDFQRYFSWIPASHTTITLCVYQHVSLQEYALIAQTLRCISLDSLRLSLQGARWVEDKSGVAGLCLQVRGDDLALHMVREKLNKRLQYQGVEAVSGVSPHIELTRKRVEYMDEVIPWRQHACIKGLANKVFVRDTQFDMFHLALHKELVDGELVGDWTRIPLLSTQGVKMSNSLSSRCGQILAS